VDLPSPSTPLGQRLRLLASLCVRAGCYDIAEKCFDLCGDLDGLVQLVSACAILFPPTTIVISDSSCYAC
jgi:hypothetical protein